ncbi:MAG: 2Fe-2S iron-sulfur cluster-binding protein, partial [Luminiphilus sp.]|nr:2Fe-2S iron-sulfur cluster-binding protein [Luminiphilus sp.]
MTRLKTRQYGQWINPETTVDFSFEGQTINGVEGDTVASALLANDQWLVSRSFKYHRPRGVLSLCGDDANTLIQTPDAPNLLADKLAVKDGLETQGQNYWGSLYFDLNRLLDWMGRFLPVGFYYKAFYKPFGIWRLWEPVVRQAAGLGIANLTVKPPYTDKIYRFCDVAVIGAGPAGLNAALTAAEAGASVILIEREPYLGGALNYHRFNEQVDETLDHRDALIDQATSHANIEVMTSATCNAWFTEHYLPVLQGDRLHKVRAKQCILATGASEQHAVFRNNDLPGILLCSAMDRLSRLYGAIPKDPVVVLAG